MTARLLLLPRTRPVARVQFAAVLTLALLLRLMVVATVFFVYPRNWLFSKAPDLGFLAHSLSSGHGLSSPFGGSTGPSAFVAPGYPVMLACLFHLFGTYSTTAGAAIIGLQTIFALLTIALLMRIAQQVFDPGVANLAGLIWSVSPPLLWLPVILWETSLSILLLTGMTALALHGAVKPGSAYWVMTGVYCGLAMLVNPSLTLALGAMLGWAFYRSRPRKADHPWLCMLALLAIFSPWPLRNARALHAFIPLRSNFGYEVWQGNHEGATGLFDADLEPLKNKQEYADYARQGEVRFMRSKRIKAESYIRSHPGLFVYRCAARMVRFWSGTGSKENSGVVALHATLISLLGIGGLVMLLRRRQAVAGLFLMPLLLFPLPYYVTHPDFRFRLILDPLLTILSAYAAVCLRNRFAARRGA